jgi:hypothetical protein
LVESRIPCVEPHCVWMWIFWHRPPPPVVICMPFSFCCLITLGEVSVWVVRIDTLYLIIEEMLIVFIP